MNKLVIIKKHVPDEIFDIIGLSNFDVLPFGDGTCKIIGRYENYFLDSAPVLEDVRKTTLNSNIYIKNTDTGKFITYQDLIKVFKMKNLTKLVNKL